MATSAPGTGAARSRCDQLLIQAGAEESRLRRHLLVAAALGEIMEPPPIVAGGTALEFYTSADCDSTDLAMYAVIGDREREGLQRAGFRPEGRHWIRDALDVPVEFLASPSEGGGALVMELGGGRARVIPSEDLYLDRLRLSAGHADPDECDEYGEALAVAAASGDRFDWSYTADRIRGEVSDDPGLARMLAHLNEAVRRTLDDIRGRGESG